MTKDGRALEGELGSLHGIVAKALKDRILSGEASTADINAAIKFLKDNGIDCVGRENPDIVDLTAGLPTFEHVEDVDILN